MAEARFEFGDFHFRQSSKLDVDELSSEMSYCYHKAKKSNQLMRLECNDGVKFINPDQIKTIGITDEK